MDIQQMAAVIIGVDGLNQLESAGLTVAPKAVWETIQNCKQEDVVNLEGKSLIICPATPSDIERITAGFFLMD